MFSSLFLISKMSSSFFEKNSQIVNRLQINGKNTGFFSRRKQDKQRQNGRNARIASRPFFSKSFGKFYFYAKTSSNAAMMSSMCSMPIDSLTKSGVKPEAIWSASLICE